MFFHDAVGQFLTKINGGAKRDVFHTCGEGTRGKVPRLPLIFRGFGESIAGIKKRIIEMTSENNSKMVLPENLQKKLS